MKRVAGDRFDPRFAQTEGLPQQSQGRNPCEPLSLPRRCLGHGAGRPSACCQDVEAGGITLRLEFHDPAHQEIQASFAGPIPKCAPAGRVHVHSPRSLARTRRGLPAGETINGEGEYRGTFDFESRAGGVVLSGSYPAEALANCLRQVFTRLIISEGGAILHAACVARNRAAHIFFGRSGAGKTTVCKLSPDCAIASDDLTAIRILNGQMLAWGLRGSQTRVRGQRSEVRNQQSAIRNSPGPFRIRAAYRLVQDTSARLIPLPKAEAVAAMLALPAVSLEPGLLGKVLELLGRLVENVPCYELRFRKDRSFWRLIEKELHDRARQDHPRKIRTRRVPDRQR